MAPIGFHNPKNSNKSSESSKGKLPGRFELGSSFSSPKCQRMKPLKWNLGKGLLRAQESFEKQGEWRIARI